jgi:hypothetical protein
MSIIVSDIEKEAKMILQKIKSGELIDTCGMSAMPTPTTEAWEVAAELSNDNALSPDQKTEIFSRLGQDVQAQLDSANYDDFDLIYEYLLQLINKK